MSLADIIWSALLAGKPGVKYGDRVVRVRWPTGLVEEVREVRRPVQHGGYL